MPKRACLKMITYAIILHMDATTYRHHLMLLTLEASIIQAIKRLHAHAERSRASVAQFQADARQKIASGQLQAMSLGGQLATAQLTDKLPDNQAIARGGHVTLQPIHLKIEHKPDTPALTLALSGAIFVARNALIDTYRKSAIATYAANSADGWIWTIEGESPCQFCLSMESTIHPLSEEFESHPNCLCSPEPWFAE